MAATDKIGIYQLDEADTLTGDESIPIDTGSDTKRATVAKIREGLLPEDGDASRTVVTPAGSSVPRSLADALAGLYDNAGLSVSRPMRVSARLTADYAPVFDLSSATLASLHCYELGAVNVPSGKQYDVIRITGTNTGNGKVFGYHFDLNGSNADTEPVRGVIGRVTVSGSGPGKAIRVGASGSGTSTAALAGISADVTPVATTTRATVVEAGNFAPSGINDNAEAIRIFSYFGARWANGIVFDQDCEYADAVIQAGMGAGSGAGAKFLKLKNSAGTTVLFDVDKLGSVYSSVDLHAGTDRTNSTKVTQSTVERTASGGTLTVKSGTSATLYLYGGDQTMIGAGGSNLVSVSGTGMALLPAQYNISFPSGATTYTVQAVAGGNYFRVLAGGTGDVVRFYASGQVTEPQGDLRLLAGKQIAVSGGGPTIVDTNGLLGLRSYTVATLPSASPAGRLLLVADGSSNRRLAVSDGAAWRFPDGAIVS
ncbi:hypothetical protein CRT60_21855 [Azospirillum palustre]|uniref:Uncharacterized protein n=1 Tax=Azospirillum palustre TaxID=2044885 RepID=A0A2B8BDP7_9PROT|nr:hypothetical protein [Azospirillum palustre]PGH55900.1 hypothetical protein CRT60_21855 [Azospirillum palustre]